MRKNFAELFRQEVRKRQQRKKKQIVLIIGVSLLTLFLIIWFIYLWLQGKIILRTAHLTTSMIPNLITTVILILAVVIIFRTIKHPSFRKYCQSLQLEKFSYWKNLKHKKLTGISVLIVLIHYTNPYGWGNLVSYLIHRPKPPQVKTALLQKNYTTIHPLVANMPSTAEKNIQSVAKYIVENEPDSYLRIKAVHDFVINWLTYDEEAGNKGIRHPQDPQTVFDTRKAVCEGYARLFEALARQIDANVVYIEGRVRLELIQDSIPSWKKLIQSKDSLTGHAWNAVEIEGNWQFVDTTWDDDVTSYRSDYLMRSPELMIESHFPDQINLPLLHFLNWQLLPFSEHKNRDSFEKQALDRPIKLTHNYQSPDRYGHL
jgi:hypothetical protein